MSEPRTVVVTGASKGIGRAICDKLLGQGHTVIGLARNFASLSEPSSRFHPHVIDLADLAVLPRYLAELVQGYPQIDAVILNAGRGRFGSLEEFSYTQIDALMALNFTAQAYIARALLPGLKRRGFGDLVFIGSEAALWGGRRGAVYSASKAALRAFAQALRDECARSSIRVCVINPGAVRSEFFNELHFCPGAAPENAILPEEVAAAVVHVLTARQGVVFDEINLSPLKKVLHFGTQKP